MNKDINEILKDVEDFEWDEGNLTKNLIKHNVSRNETEQAFVNVPRLYADDPYHSQDEDRYICYGITNNNRQLFISFTLRNNKIRPISVRDQDRKERRFYEQATSEKAA